MYKLHYESDYDKRILLSYRAVKMQQGLHTFMSSDGLNPPIQRKKRSTEVLHIPDIK